MINIILCSASIDGINLSKELLHKCTNIHIAAVATTSDDLLTLLVKNIDADIIVLDIWLPFTNSLLLIKTIKKSYKHYKILVHSIIDDLAILKLLMSYGIAGFLCKKEQLTLFLEEAITNVYLEGFHYPFWCETVIEVAREQKSKMPENGIFSITKQEEIIFKLLPTDKTCKEIAAIVGIEKRTAEVHCLNLYRKLGVTTRAGAVEIGSFKPFFVHYLA